MSETPADLRQHQADYGIDGSFGRLSPRWQGSLLGAVCAVLLVIAGTKAVSGELLSALICALMAGCLLASAFCYLRTTRRGKFEVWAGVLTGLELRGDERLLDMGCGRGAVLLSAARRLPRGHAVGVDLWRADQTGNAADATLHNAQLEGVADRVELRTGDMTQLPLEDDSVDVVVSSLAIHNIPGVAGRRQAIDEAARVLRPGGRLVIADLWATRSHVRQLRELGMARVRRRNLGWRMWWGGPWVPTHLVTADQPRPGEAPERS